MWYLLLSVALYLSSSGLLHCEKKRNKSIHSPAECKHSLIVDLWCTHSCHSVQWDAGSTQKPSLWVSLWEEAVCWKRMWPTPWTSLNCPPLSDHLQQQHSTLQHSTTPRAQQDLNKHVFWQDPMPLQGWANYGK